MRILVVEDEPKIAASITAALADAGCKAEIASDGEDAWFRGDTEDYDLIILDLGLAEARRACRAEALASGRAKDACHRAHCARRGGRARRRHRLWGRRLSGEAFPYGGADGARAGADPPLGGAWSRLSSRRVELPSIRARCGSPWTAFLWRWSPLEYRLVCLSPASQGGAWYRRARSSSTLRR